MQRRHKALWAVLIVIGLLWASCAYAVTIDYDRMGNMQVQLELPAGFGSVEVSLYRIGEIKNELGGLQYEFLEPFRDCGATLEYHTASEADAAARKIEKFIDRASIQPLDRKLSNAKGQVDFKNLTPGVYFGRKSGGESRVDMIPFIVPVPYYQDKALEYKVSVYPKIEIRPTPTPTCTPRPHNDDEKLPQTGVVRWPVVALSLSGCVLLLIDILFIRYDNRRRRKE